MNHAQFDAIALILLALGTWFYTQALGRLNRRVRDLEQDRTAHAAALREAYASHAWALYRLRGVFDQHAEQPGHGPHDDGGDPGPAAGAVPRPPLRVPSRCDPTVGWGRGEDLVMGCLAAGLAVLGGVALGLGVGCLCWFGLTGWGLLITAVGVAALGLLILLVALLWLHTDPGVSSH
jgi:hypothetical protein